MSTYTKVKLSSSTNGKFIKVSASQIGSGSGTAIHTADATALDEIWLYAQNTDTSSRKLTVGWGGTTDPDDLIEVTIPAEAGLYCVVPGLVLTGGLAVMAMGSSSTVLLLGGYVNRIT